MWFAVAQKYGRLSVTVTVCVPQDSGGLREQQGEATRRRLVAAAVELIESGEEPSMRAVAKHAGAGERTIYRYFPTKGDLQEAVFGELGDRVGAAPPGAATGLEEYAQRLYEAFSANPRLVEALVTAAWMTPVFRRSRGRNLAALQALLDSAFPDAPKACRQAATASMRVPLSGAGWLYLTQCGLSHAEIVAQGQWLVRSHLATLRREQNRVRKQARQ